jgi:hypothetical protein
MGAAIAPPGPRRWVADVRPDGVELRTIVRRWSSAPGPSARLARVACGTALRAARLAVAVQGRFPLVSHPEKPGVLAVVHAGGPVPARHRDLLLHAVLVSGRSPASAVRPPTRSAAVLQLCSAAESEKAWLRVLRTVPTAGAALGPCWHDLDADGPAAAGSGESFAAVVGSPGSGPLADLRLGQAVEAIRLTAAAMGLDMRVLAAPAAVTSPDLRPHLHGSADAVAVVEFGRNDRARSLVPVAGDERPGRMDGGAVHR